MKYGKIVTFKIESNSVLDLQTYIKSLKTFADGNAIFNRISIAYVTEEPCVDKVEWVWLFVKLRMMVKYI